MHVGHHRDMAVNEGKGRDIEQLLARRLFQRHATGPRLDRRVSVVKNLIHLLFLRFGRPPEVVEPCGGMQTKIPSEAIAGREISV
jgi:hypothetical protein